jgi:hypothetical protein
LEELVGLNAEFARDLAQAQHCSLWLVDEGKRQLWTDYDMLPLPSGSFAFTLGDVSGKRGTGRGDDGQHPDTVA